jgi:hypothetical protein
MFNWRTVVGLILVTIGMLNLYSAFLGNGNNLGVNQNYTRLTCFIWIAVGCLLLYRGTRKNP